MMISIASDNIELDIASTFTRLANDRMGPPALRIREKPMTEYQYVFFSARHVVLPNVQVPPTAKCETM